MLGQEKNEKRINFRVSPMAVNKRVLIFFALVLGTAIILRPVQVTLRDQIENVRDNFIQLTRESYGLRIQFASMGPSIFGSLDIRNVQVLREDDSVFLSMSRLRLSFSLFELIRGNTLGAFRSVNIDRPVLNLDFEKDAALQKRLITGTQAQENAGSIRELLPENFSVNIRNGQWEVSDSAGRFRFHNVGFDASIRQNRLSFQGRWNAEASLTGGIRTVMAARFNGDYLADIGEGSAAVTIQSAYGDNFRIRPLSISFFLSREQLEIRKAYDRTPGSFSLFYDIAEGRLQGRFEGNGFSPSSMFVLTGALREYNPLLDLRISGTAGFERENTGKFQFYVDLSGVGPSTGNSFLDHAIFNVGIDGNTNHIAVNRLNFRSPLGSLRFVGGADLNTTDYVPIVPYGTLNLSNFRLHGERGINADISLETSGNEIILFSNNFTAENFAFSAFVLSLAFEQQGFCFVFSALSNGAEENQDVYLSSFILEGSADYNPRQVRANLRLDSFSMGDILGLFEPFVSFSAISSLARSVAEDVSITTEVFFTTDFVNILYNAPQIAITYNGSQDISVIASIFGTDRMVELNSCLISWENGTADFSGFLDYSNPNNITFSAGAIVQNLVYFFDGHIQDRRNVRVSGSYGFEVNLSSWETGVIAGYARGNNIPFPSGRGFATLDFLVSILYESPTLWQARIDRFEIAGLSTPASSSANLSFSGAANESGITIPNLFFDDGKGVLSGNIILDWNHTFDYCDFAVYITGHNRNEFYRINGSYRDERLELSALGQGMQFARFTAQNAVVDGSLNLLWESAASFTAETIISSFTINQSGLHASAKINIDNNIFLTEQLNIQYSGLELNVPFIRVDRYASTAQTTAWASGFLADMPVEINLSGDAKFNSSATWPELFRDFNFLDAILNVSAARYDTMVAEEPFAFTMSLRQENSGHAIDIHGGPRDMLRFRYNTEPNGGIFFAALSAPSPARGTLFGSIDSGRIDANTTDLYVDMGALWRFIPPLDVIAFPGGIVTASIRVGGTLEDPEFYGTARATSLQILIPEFLPEPIRPVPITINLNGTEMSFGPVQATVGHGGGVASGWARFDQWIPNIFNFDIFVSHEHPIPYGLDIGGFMANGLTSGRLVLAMEDLIFSVTGDLIAYHTEISVDADELMAMAAGQAAEDELITVNVDISIQAGRRVEFFWPSVNLPIIQAHADMGTGIHIVADTATGSFALNGDVRLRGGEIFYLERNFYIREGVIAFRENETHFDPRISARAEIREQAVIGPVTISMIVSEAPLMSFSPRFVSNPPISQLEIYTLLGQVPQGDEDQRNFAASLALDTLAHFTVMRRVEREVRDFLGLDMFSMRTQVFQNMLLQATGLAPNPFDRPYRVANYFDNSTIVLGSFFGVDIFGEAMINFRYDERRENWGGMFLEPEFALEMRNPLFDIRFAAAPHSPGNLFIDDMSISLIWRRTF